MLHRQQRKIHDLETVPIGEARWEIQVNSAERVWITANSTATKRVPSAALLQICYFDSDGNRVPFSWRNSSKRAGEYQYLEPAGPEEYVRTRFLLPVPTGASTLELVGKNWNRYVRTFIQGGIMVEKLSGDSVGENVFDIDNEMSAKDYHSRVEIQKSAARATITVRHRAGDSPSSGPMTVKYFDGQERELMNPGDLAQHPKHGAYFILQGDSSTSSTTEVSIELPNEARWMEITGLDWAKKTAILEGEPSIEFENGLASQIKNFLDRIPATAQLFIVDTTAPPLGHETLALRPNNLAPNYEDLGIWVIFLPFGSLQNYEPKVSEKILQVPRDAYSVLIDSLLEFRSSENSVYICSSFPNFQSLSSITLLKGLGWKVVYECRDDMEEFNRVGYSKWYSQELERYCLKLADTVVAVSPALAEKLEDMSADSIKALVNPNGVAINTANNGSVLRTSETLESRRSSQTVGYVGHLTASWFDWPAVIFAATTLPDVRFEIVGHGMPENLSLPENVHYLGAKTHDELLSVVREWKVGLIPFLDSPLTRSVDPNKIYEYFAWGLRCVSSEMGSVSHYPSTWVYSGRQEFVSALKEALDSAMDEEELQALREFVSQCTWADRAREMSEIIG